MPVPPYFLIATDLDGTLLSPDHTVTARTQEVLASLLRTYNGPARADGSHPVAFALASGRHIVDVAAVLKLLNLHHAEPAQSETQDKQKDPIHLLFIVSSNGACAHRCIIDSRSDAEHPIRLEIVHKRDVPTPIVKRLLFILDDLTAEINAGKDATTAAQYNAREEININLYQHDGWRCSLDWTDQLEYHKTSGFRYTMYDPLALAKTYDEETKGVAEPDADLEGRTCLSGVSKVFFGCEDPAVIQRLRALIQRKLATTGPNGEPVLPLSITSSSPYIMEITAANTTKVTGLESLLQYIPTSSAGVQLTLGENAIAFGDGENDVEMLQAVKKGYLMSNASDAVRALVFAGTNPSSSSVEVIDSNKNDGVAKKLTELFLSN